MEICTSRGFGAFISSFLPTHGGVRAGGRRSAVGVASPEGIESPEEAEWIPGGFHEIFSGPDVEAVPARWFVSFGLRFFWDRTKRRLEREKEKEEFAPESVRIFSTANTSEAHQLRNQQQTPC